MLLFDRYIYMLLFDRYIHIYIYICVCVYVCLPPVALQSDTGEHIIINDKIFPVECLLKHHYRHKTLCEKMKVIWFYIQPDT